MTHPTFKDQMQQLSRHGIGASEIATVAGLNPYESPWSLWLRKTGQAPDVEQTEPMEWGNRLEPAIRQKYVDATGAPVFVPRESIFHYRTPWARATPDGIKLRQGHAEAMAFPANWHYLLQCKNVGYWAARAWEHGPPDYVQLQEQWEMYVTELERADVAALFGGNEFRVYTVHRDQKIIDDLVEMATAFWKKVETKEAPAVDGSDACRVHFAKQLNKDAAAELVADTKAEELLAEWRLLHRQAKASGERVRVIRNLLLADLVAAKASRLVSTTGVARLQTRTCRPETNYKLVAELVASKACDGCQQVHTSHESFRALITESTDTTLCESTTTLVAPREWGKEHV